MKEDFVTPALGILEHVDVRLIWSKEASGFTPWLAHNLPMLGEALGLELELETTEAPCGDFSCDLVTKDLNTDRTVIIENQLNPTDHDHLGKLLTYASGYDAGAIVWVAPVFRDEHRQALDWLNQRTSQNTDFFGVVIEALRVDQSKPAVNFRVVAMPNEWRKAKAGAVKALTPKGELYQEYFQALIDELREVHHFTGARMGQPQNWYSFASGYSGIVYGASFAQGGQVRTDLYIDRGEQDENKQLFDELAKRRSVIESGVGEALQWERLEEKRASRIAFYRAGFIEMSSVQLAEIRAWHIQHLLSLKNVFEPLLEEIL